MPRVEGSNCFGILPAVCGADKAASYIGLAADARVRKDVTNLVGHENLRWTSPGQAEIENLDPERLNMLLDGVGRIRKVDCY
jgi:Peptidase inhibitor I78 family